MCLNVGMIFKNKIVGMSKPYAKNIKFDEYKKCLDGEDIKKNVKFKF